MNQVLLFVHILSASAWLGAALWVAGDVRRTLALGKPHLAALPARVAPALGLDLWAGVATVLTGLAVLFYVGGHPPVSIMIGFVVALLRLGVVALGLKPAWSRLAARIAGGETVPAGDPAARKLGMWSGIGHTLWLAALVTMVLGS